MSKVLLTNGDEALSPLSPKTHEQAESSLSLALIDSYHTSYTRTEMGIPAWRHSLSEPQYSASRVSKGELSQLDASPVETNCWRRTRITHRLFPALGAKQSGKRVRFICQMWLTGHCLNLDLVCILRLQIVRAQVLQLLQPCTETTEKRGVEGLTLHLPPQQSLLPSLFELGCRKSQSV